MSVSGRRKAYGQHFLKDPHVIQSICQAVFSEQSQTKASHLSEIGPGKGAITLPILEENRIQNAFQKVTLVEKDARLFPEIESFLHSNETLVKGDFLEIPDESLFPESQSPKDTLFVSNLPYSSSVAILDRLLRFRPQIPALVLMFQAEVANRITARENTKSRGSLSVWVQNEWEVETLVHVPPKSFRPPPKVDSKVLILRPRPAPLIPCTTEDPRLWEFLLKSCFASRRKMLRSSLKKFTLPGAQNTLFDVLEASEIEGSLRAEALSWEHWEKLMVNLLGLR